MSWSKKLQAEQKQEIILNKQMNRPWGYYIVTSVGDGFQTKHWFVLSGTANVILNNEEKVLSPGQSIDIPVKAIHSLQNLQNKELKIIEIQTGDILSEEDIIRYSDIYGRV